MADQDNKGGRVALMGALLALLVGALASAVWLAGDALLLSRSVNEGRIVADMAETVGRWASQYGGLHARTQGASAALPGTFLTRSVYAGTDGDAGVLQGSRSEHRLDERAAMERVEAYHWKNPALIQREVADTLLASGSRAQYRLTARTVLNRNNAPNAFELEALEVLQSAFLRLGKQSAPSGSDAALPSAQDRSHQEYWRVEGGQLLYARAVVAQASCLRCHDTPEKAPEFLKANQQFNGGGGFGYKVGQPVGLISVKLPVATSATLLRDGVPPLAWGALAVAVLAGLGILRLSMGGRQPQA